MLLLRRSRPCSSDKAGLLDEALGVLTAGACQSLLLLHGIPQTANSSWRLVLSSLFLCAAAFDKDDLLYLRDKEQEQRHQEQHKRDAEAAAFAAARAAAEAQAEAQAAKLLRQQQQAEATRCGLATGACRSVY